MIAGKASSAANEVGFSSFDGLGVLLMCWLQW